MSAIFYNLGPVTITKNCSFDYDYNTTVPPVILDGGRDVLLANFHGPKSLKCSSVNGGLAKPAPEHTYAVVNREFLCDCQLDLEHASVLRQTSSCSKGSSSKMQNENFRVPTTNAKVKVVTAGRAFGVWNNKDSTFQFKLPSGICTADVTFMGTLGVHKFHFTSDSAKASHVAWEQLDYDHTTHAFLLDHTFTHHGKHPQVVELPLPRVTGFTEYYNPTRPSHLVSGALVRHHKSYSPTEIRSMRTVGLEHSPAYFSRRAHSASRTPSRASSHGRACPNHDP